MTVTLPESARYCRVLARRTGRNFYFSFLTLPRRLRHDMCVLYAFMRLTDDIGDDDGVEIVERRRRLSAWRDDLRAILAGETRESPVFPALADVVRRHAIPPESLEEVISGVEFDLSPARIETFDDLSRYCDQVAGAVGLCCIHIWGFHDDRASQAALDCGRAFQLTNILRDLHEDAKSGRVYIPSDELTRFGYTHRDLARGVLDERFAELMRFQTDRARRDYVKAAALHDYLNRPGRPILSAMLRIYGGLLREIERRDFDVFSGRVEISPSRKLSIALTSAAGRRFHPDSLQ